MNGLKKELDSFFSNLPESPQFKTKVKATALKRLETFPTAYRLAHKCSYYSKKWRGNIRDILPIEWLILRLLILKVWGDVFLNYPVVEEE